jgi:NB-ARC domain
MGPAPGNGDRGADEAGEPRPLVQQTASASGQAQQPFQGHGVQINCFYCWERAPEPVVSIAPPTGLRDGHLPLRGREGLLVDLAAPGEARVWVLHGLGGCGKTRLAMEAAFAAQQRGAEVWWVSAAEPDRLVAEMRALGRRLGISETQLEHGDVADVIWQRLAGRREPWLLVIDNADDPRVLAGAGTCVAEGRGWLRPVAGQAGMVLVTSRDGSPASWGRWARRHRLEMLAVDAAAAVLADHARHHPELGGVNDARLLAARLGGLPLALMLAGSFLAESVTTPAASAAPHAVRSYRQYLEAIEDWQLQAVFPPSADELTPSSALQMIGRTWDLTLDLLAARQMPEARHVLPVLACLGDAPIPCELLDVNTLRDSPLLEGITESRLRDVLKTLAGFGLIDMIPAVGANPPVICLHPLVCDTSRPSPSNSNPHELEMYRTLFGELINRYYDAEITRRSEDPSAGPGGMTPAEWRSLRLLEMSIRARPLR